MSTPQPSDIVIVTTAAKLAGLIDDAVARAVQRALADVLATRKDGVAWMTSREAERVYGRSRSTLYRWRRDGLVASKKVAGTVYFARPAAGDASGGATLPTTAADAAR